MAQAIGRAAGGPGPLVTVRINSPASWLTMRCISALSAFWIWRNSIFE